MRAVGVHVRGVRDVVRGQGRGEAVGVLGRDVDVLGGVPEKEGGDAAVTNASSEVARRSSGEASSPRRIIREGRYVSVSIDVIA